jgi:hypothetical protein
MSLADLIKQESVMLLHKSRRTECLLCKIKEMYTYSEDFFMKAFFTLRARGVSTMVLVVGGGVQLSVFNRLPTEGYTQGGKFWVRGRRDQELEGARYTNLRQVQAARYVIPYVLYAGLYCL